MQMQTHAWEQSLLSLAYEARPPDVASSQLKIDAARLANAYHYCDTLTAEHSRSFYLASALLPPEKRQAIRALYAFCRTTDDIVDCAVGNQHAQLVQWRQRVLSLPVDIYDPVVLAWTHIRQRYRIPNRYAEQLIDGVGCDLTQFRYATFEELAAYCYGVASTVGLMSMYIIGFADARAIPYAIKLGVALQVTNILRDVGEDWRRGRLYLPQADLERFRIAERDIAESVASGSVSASWQRFMCYQIERNRRLYQESLPGIHHLHPDGRFAVSAAVSFYSAILHEIEKHRYNVFTRRACVSKWAKIRQLPKIWWQNRS